MRVQTLASVLILSAALWPGSVFGQDVSALDFLRVSYVGDGSTPSALALFENQARQAQPPRVAGSVSEDGSYAYTLPIELPPALLAPELALVWSADLSPHTPISPGWSVQAGATITLMSSLERSEVWNDLDVGGEQGVYRVSGGGLGGILFKSGAEWKYFAQDAKPVVVERAGNTWTIRTDGVTTTLAPDNRYFWPTGASPAEGPQTWRTVRVRDGGANTVEYQWTGARLDRVRFGGATDISGQPLPNADHLFDIWLDYSIAGLRSRRAVEGRIDEIDQRLDAIRVVSAADTAAGYKYHLHYQVPWQSVPADQILARVTRTSLADVESRQVAAFEYAGLPTTTPAGVEAFEWTPAAPSSVGWTSQRSRSGTRVSGSSRHEGLFDITGDGLPDIVNFGDNTSSFAWNAASLDMGFPHFGSGGLARAATGYWTATGQATVQAPNAPVAGPSLSDWWDLGLWESPADLEETASFRCAAAMAGHWDSASYTIRKLADINGDGHDDLIFANQLPPELLNPWSEPDPGYGGTIDRYTCTPWYLVQSPSWSFTIHWGQPGGFSATPVVAPAPLPAASVGSAPTVAHVAPLNLQLPEQFVELGEGGQGDLIDVDGDGWLDIVGVVPYGPDESELWVWYHSGERAGHWATEPVVASATVPSLQLSLRSLQTTRHHGVRVPVDSDRDWDSVPDHTSPRIVRSETVKALRDINGDGLPDFVDATSWTASTPHWMVWLGTGSRDFDGFDGPHAWPAPLDMLSAADEGVPAPNVCVVSGVDVGGVTPTTMGACLDIDERLTDSLGVSNGVANCSIERSAPGADVNCGYDPMLNLPLTDAWRQEQLVSLLDVDGDGLTDLVDGEFDLAAGAPARSMAWYRNTGVRFEAQGRAIPAHLLSDEPNKSALLGLIRSEQWVIRHAEVDALNAAHPAAVVPSNTISQTIYLVADVNGDRLPDVVHSGLDPTNRDVRYASTEWDPLGRRNRPGMLKTVTGAHGAVTELGFTTSAQYSPAGDPSFATQDMPRPREVVSTVKVTDFATSVASAVQYDYADGVMEGGHFLGFGERTATHWESDASGAWNTPFRPVRRETSRFWLAREGRARTDHLVEINGASVTMPEGAAPSSLAWRAVERSRVAYAGHTVGAPGFAQATALLPSSRCYVEQSEQQAASITRASRVSLVRDADGQVTEVTHQPVLAPLSMNASAWADPNPAAQPCTGSNGDGAIRNSFTWLANSEGSMFRMASTRTEHWEVGEGWVVDEFGEFEYDNSLYGVLDEGRLTRQTAWVVDGGNPWTDVETWDFWWTDRGALASRYAPGNGGRYSAWGYTLGDAVPWLEINAVWQATYHYYDALGRRVETWSPDGLRQEWTHDSHGRVLTESLRPADNGAYGPAWLMKESFYFDDSWTGASRVQEVAYRHGASTQTGPAAPVERWVYYNGFGDEAGSAERVGPASWLVRQRVVDPAGKLLRETRPRTETYLPFDASVLPTADTQVANRYDGRGRVREAWTDREEGLGHQIVDLNHPGLRFTSDELGYQARHTLDRLGRLRVVEEGKDGVLLETGRYEYDGRDRITRFTDAEGNQYRYDFDLVGRLRQVTRQASCVGAYGPCTTAEQPWYAYDYDGPEPTEMWEGEAGTGTLAVTWQHDPLGRPLAKNVLHRATNTWDTTSWSWDTARPGHLSQVTVNAPSLNQTVTDIHHYAGLPGYGWAGAPSGLTRMWSDGSGAYTAHYGYAHDLRGTRTLTVSPTGAEVQARFDLYADRVAAHEVSPPWGSSASPQTVTYEYNGWGQQAAWSSWVSGTSGTKLLRQETLRSSPAQVAGVSFQRGTNYQTIDYGYEENGLLATRYYSGVNWSVDYDYDLLQRVQRVDRYGGGVHPVGFFTYDTLGRPLSAKGADNRTWEYERGAFSQVHRRTSPSGRPAQEHAYDAQGRLTSYFAPPPSGETGERLSFTYDGAGRLSALEKREVWAWGPGIYSETVSDALTYVYDAADVIAREQSYTEDLLRLEGYRLDANSGRYTDKLLPMLSAENRPGASSPWRWSLVEPDGHALATFDGDADTELSWELLGAYGDVHVATGPSPWDRDGLHGAEGPRGTGVIHHGARHMLARGDGLWLQPEPLLYLGMTNGDPGRPRAYSGVYAGGNPVMWEDRSGRHPAAIAWAIAEVSFTVADVAMAASSLSAFAAAPSWGTAAVAAFDVGGAAAGVVGPAGGYTTAARGVYAGVDAAATSLRRANAVDTGVDASKAGGGFIVHANGTAVHKSQAEMVDSIAGAGATKIGDATRTAEGGAIYRMDTPNGPMDVRVMDGQPGGGANQGPRTVTTRAGTNQGVHPDGSQVKAPGRQGGPTKDEVQEAMHTHGQVNDR